MHASEILPPPFPHPRGLRTLIFPRLILAQDKRPTHSCLHVFRPTKEAKSR